MVLYLRSVLSASEMAGFLTALLHAALLLRDIQHRVELFKLTDVKYEYVCV